MVWAVSGMIGNYVGSWLVLNATAVELWLSFSAIAGLGVLLAAYFYATERQHGPVALSAVEAPSGQNGRCKPPGPENT